MSFKVLRGVSAALVASLVAAAHAGTLPYDFTFTPPSGMNFSTLSLVAKTHGSLIGNWDAVDNPTGTRTKPGLFGTFEPHENLPVPAAVDLTTAGTPSVPLGGTFRMDLAAGAGALLLSNYGAAMSGPAGGGLTLSATILTDPFRTRQPTSTFPGGIPVTIPLGDATITALYLQQIGDAPGTLTPTGPNSFDFVVAPIVNLSGMVNLAGSDVAFGPIATALPLTGSIMLSGDEATLMSLAVIEASDVQHPNLALPPIPFELPTVLPPGDVAHIIFNLTLTEIAAALNGTVTTNAAGTLVPEPAGGVLVVIGCLIIARRRSR